MVASSPGPMEAEMIQQTRKTTHHDAPNFEVGNILFHFLEFVPARCGPCGSDGGCQPPSSLSTPEHAASKPCSTWTWLQTIQRTAHPRAIPHCQVPTQRYSPASSTCAPDISSLSHPEKCQHQAAPRSEQGFDRAEQQLTARQDSTPTGAFHSRGRCAQHRTRPCGPS